MTFRWDLTIGLREAGGLCRLLALEKWRKGILCFGLAGALCAWMYTGAFSTPTRVLIAAGAAIAVMTLFTLGLVVYTQMSLRAQTRRAGKESYVQETEISGLGIRVTVGKNRAKLAFDQLARVKETRGAFYLFLSADQAWILPKAQMEKEEFPPLRALLRTVVEKRKLELRRG